MKSYSKAGSTENSAAGAVTTTTTTTGSGNTTVPKKKGVKTEEANEVAGFLLSLKNQRSVSPDPNDALDAATTATTAEVSTSSAAPEPTTDTSVPPTMTIEEVTPTVVAPTPIESTTVAATASEDTTISSTGVITGYAGPPPELTVFPGIPVAYPTPSYSYPSSTLLGTESTTSTTTLKKANGKEKKLKKSLESGVIGTSDVTALQAMIDEFVEYDLTKFVDESNPLVQYKDRDLVPDSLFVAMLQMKVCYLTQADRVGCYKTRDLGFVGMCCKHCNGQPGFGRYFPNSVRSLAQTTTSQTILKHIASKCRFCPPNIREVVVELMRQQTIREAAAAAVTDHTIHNVIAGASSGAVTSSSSTVSAGRPRYGSRKIFFQRVWSRLHAGTLGISATDEDMDDYNMGSENDGDGDNYIPSSVIDDVVTQAIGESEVTAAAVKEQHDDEGALATATTVPNNKRTLPLMGKNKKQKLEDEVAEV